MKLQIILLMLIGTVSLMASENQEEYHEPLPSALAMDVAIEKAIFCGTFLDKTMFYNDEFIKCATLGLVNQRRTVTVYDVMSILYKAKCQTSLYPKDLTSDQIEIVFLPLAQRIIKKIQ